MIYYNFCGFGSFMTASFLGKYLAIFRLKRYFKKLSNAEIWLLNAHQTHTKISVPRDKTCPMGQTQVGAIWYQCVSNQITNFRSNASRCEVFLHSFGVFLHETFSLSEITL